MEPGKGPLIEKREKRTWREIGNRRFKKTKDRWVKRGKGGRKDPKDEELRGKLQKREGKTIH